MLFNQLFNGAASIANHASGQTQGCGNELVVDNDQSQIMALIAFFQKNILTDLSGSLDGFTHFCRLGQADGKCPCPARLLPV